MKKKIALIFGGCSPEYGVSLQSAYGVATHMDKDKYELIYIGVTRDGEWLLYSGDLEAIRDNTWMSGPCVRAALLPSRGMGGVLRIESESKTRVSLIDAAFPVMHGKNGEDGTIQGLLELVQIPIIGCGLSASAICMDKDVAHRVAQSAGVCIPRYVTLYSVADLDWAITMIEDMVFPLFVKPARGGSSIGMTKLKSADGLKEAVEAAFSHDDKVLIEEGVSGAEVGCAVIGNGELILGEVDEIELNQFFFDFEEKYAQRNTRIHTPARISAETSERIKRTAKELYRAMGCRGFARVDMFLTKDNEIVFNEINTIPGLTVNSRFPRMMACAGMPMEAVMDKLVQLATRV